MSADNVIYIQKRLDDRWWVWMDFMSRDDPPTPERGSESAKSFLNDIRAFRYAVELSESLPIVEYGIINLAPQTGDAEMGKKKNTDTKLIRKYVKDARKSLEAAYLLQQDNEPMLEEDCPFAFDDHWYASWTLASFLGCEGAVFCPFCDVEFPITWEIDEPQEEPEPPDLWEVADRIEDDLDDLRKRAAFDANIEQ